MSRDMTASDAVNKCRDVVTRDAAASQNTSRAVMVNYETVHNISLASAVGVMLYGEYLQWCYAATLVTPASGTWGVYLAYRGLANVELLRYFKIGVAMLSYGGSVCLVTAASQCKPITDVAIAGVSAARAGISFAKNPVKWSRYWAREAWRQCTQRTEDWDDWDMMNDLMLPPTKARWT